MKRKPKKTTIDKKILKLWSVIVRTKANDRCELCGSTGRLNAHHFYGRKNRATRYHIDNGVCLCYSCHTGSVKSAHESPEWFREKMIEKRGKKWLERLTNKWIEIKKYDIIDLQIIYEKLNK